MNVAPTPTHRFVIVLLYDGMPSDAKPYVLDPANLTYPIIFAYATFAFGMVVGTL